MVKGLQAAAQGMMARVSAHDVIANNLANAATVGFQREVATVVAARSAATRQAGTGRASAITLVPRVSTDARPGALRQTGNPTDVALDGAGYFVVQTARGERLWRGGSLRVDAAGQLTTGDGSALLDASGKPVAVRGPGWAVAQDGTVTSGGTTVGQLRIVSPVGAVAHEGGVLLAAQRSAPVAAGSTRVLQGFVEHSNVDAVHEMVDMISGMRAYEANQKAVTAQDQSLQNLFQVLAR